MISSHIQDYLSFSSKSVVVARVILCIAILIRTFERLWFFLTYKSQLPSLYNHSLNPFNLENFSIINGSIYLVPTLYIMLILACGYFIINKAYHKTNSIILVILITLTSFDSIYIGQGLRIFWPYLIFFSCLPQVPLSNFRKNFSYYNPFLNIAVFLFLGLIYFFSYYFKSNKVWTSSYDALWYFLKSEQWTLDWARSLTNFPNLLKIGTVLTLILEASVISLLIISVLKFIKFKHSFKNILSVTFIIFHSIIGLITILKAFSLGMISLWVLFLKKRTPHSTKKFKMNKLNIILVIYIFTSLFTWNLLPKDLNILKNNSTHEISLKDLKKITIPQYWGLVSPAPGFHNWEVKVTSKSTGQNKESILFDSRENITNQYFSDAFFTAAFKENSLLDAYKEKYCTDKSSEIIFKYYKNKIVRFNDEKIENKRFIITRKCDS